MPTVRVFGALLCLALAGMPARVRAEPGGAAIRVPNADFERRVRPAATAYGCCFEKWLFAVRSGAYGLSAHEEEGRSTYARLTSRGKAGRADLMSPLFPLRSFAEVRVRASVRRKGATGVVALHPTYQRRHVDLALVEGPEGTWRDLDVTLRAGTASGDYRITFGVVGEGYLEVDDVKVDLVGRAKRAEGTVLIVDLNDRPADYEIPTGWWIGKDIAAVWGYDVVVWSYRDFTEKRLQKLAPVAVILSPWSGKPPAGDKKTRAAARTDTYPLLRKTKIPTLGICFGHQWLGWSKGVEVHGEAEKGDVTLKPLRKDPIFEGLSGSFPCSQSHRFALTRVPPGYLHLARSKVTAIHTIKAKRRPVYGFQGHFERGWESTTPHGRILMGNFFHLVEEARGKAR